MRIRWTLVMHLVGIVATSHAFAAEALDVKAVLGRPIIDASLPLEEVQTYTESRVPPMPEVASVAEWEQHAERMRRETLDRVVFRGQAAEWRDAPTQIEWFDTIPGDETYHIRKLRYEILPGLWIPALLYEPEQLAGRVPVVMNVNGHDRDGKAAPYKQIRCINLAKRGMLALNVEWLGMGQLNSPNFTHYRMNQLNLCGTSGLAPFYLSMSRGLDVLLSHEHADPQRVAVSGLSGGGWQTIFISALDTRVTLSNPVAGYSSFRTRARHHSDLGDSEQTPCDLATVTDYAQLTAMRAPRPTLLTFNAEDNCCFRSGHALPPLLDAAGPIFDLYGKRAALRAHVNFSPGNHNFGQDNREAFYRMLGDHFLDGQEFDPAEISCDEQIKTSEELQVELPADNADFCSLARSLSQDLPRCVVPPADANAVDDWVRQRRELLAQTVRAKSYDVAAEEAAREEIGEAQVVFRRFKLSETWTVPAVELVPAAPKETVIVIADGGRVEAAAQIEKLFAAGARVLAVDPFYFGESKISSRDFLFALLIDAIGDRPLGLQASQIAAISRWAAQQPAGPGVRLVAVGPRSSLIALTAAALEPNAINGVELHGAFDSLKSVIEKNMSVNEAPELFCFGLLEHFDIPQLTALVNPRPVHFVPER